MRTPDDLRRCLETLKSLVEDRTALTALSAEERKNLIIAAGRLSRPARDEARALSRALRKDRNEKRQAEERALRATTQIRQARLSPVYVPPVREFPTQAPEARELKKPRYCYACKAPFTSLHFFYDSMCPACAAFNYEKRFQSADLSGRTALVTGARVKIGYQAALKLLRAGARVVATTRFPHDAALRYAKEADFGQWGGRLQIHGLDLRHTPSVEIFARYLNAELPGLDFLLNNAAQTVRRPPAWHAHLLENEARPAAELGHEARRLLRPHEELKSALSRAALPAAGSVETGLTTWNDGSAGVGLRDSARLSQLRYAYDEDACGPEVFPQGRTDSDLQQVDLRTRNTWRLTLSEVATPEMLEVHLINAVAPFVLCARLKTLMLRKKTFDKHIVNVSAMEGIFSRGTKTDKHPHTNMAKAALNMMTLTSAPDCAKDGIFMNAVDTGWVTDEDPAVHAQRKQTELDFQPPLDIVDGAARICDPVFSGIATGRHAFGKFFKDYKPAAW